MRACATLSASKMRNSREKIRGYYARYTQAAEDRGRKDDQDKLQRELTDDRLLLRYNVLDHVWQIWYDAPMSGIYCVTSLEPYVYGLHKAIRQIRTQQQTGRQMKDAYLKNQQDLADRQEAKMNEISREVAKTLSKHHTGKVTTAG